MLNLTLVQVPCPSVLCKMENVNTFADEEHEEVSTSGTANRPDSITIEMSFEFRASPRSTTNKIVEMEQLWYKMALKCCKSHAGYIRFYKLTGQRWR